MIRRNVGGLLIGAGGLVLYRGYRVTGWFGLVAGGSILVGGVLLLTASIRYCPINRLPRVDTRGMEEPHDGESSPRSTP